MLQANNCETKLLANSTRARTGRARNVARYVDQHTGLSLKKIGFLNSPKIVWRLTLCPSARSDTMSQTGERTGQWWSYFKTQRLQILQWCARCRDTGETRWSTDLQHISDAPQASSPHTSCTSSPTPSSCAAPPTSALPSAADSSQTAAASPRAALFHAVAEGPSQIRAARCRRSSSA